MGESAGEAPLQWLARQYRNWRDGREATAYVEALAQWELERDRLDEALAAAAPDAEPATSQVGTRLRPGEFLQCEMWNVCLVETRELPAETISHQLNLGLRTPVSIGLGTTRTLPTPSPDESMELDTGTVAITDQRVTFAGPKHAREWKLDELIRPVHDASSGTVYLPVSSRALTSGIRHGPHLNRLAETSLAIALARHSGDWAVIDRWRAERRQLERERPRPPADVRVDAHAVADAKARALAPGRARAPTARPAGQLVGRRFLARVVDWMLALTFFGWLLTTFDEGMGVFVGFALAVTSYEVLASAKWGRSVGKLLAGLAVVDRDTGGRPTQWRLLLRSAAWGASVLTVFGPWIQLVLLATNPTGTTWHDRLAGTKVVATR